MNSDKKMYEQLLKYHPEFKDSKEDIKKVIYQLQKVNPDIKVNQVFADKLKNRLNSMAEYKTQEKKSTFWLFSFFVPVFTFWFAVFGFWYLSDDLISPDENFQHEIMPTGWAAPAMFQMKVSEQNQSENTRMLMMPSGDESTQNDQMQDIFEVESFMADIRDDYLLWCEDNLGQISTLNDQTRVCNLEKTTCLENDFYEGNCITQEK